MSRGSRWRRAGLSPPWVTFHDELVNTIGKTPGVVVSPLAEINSGHYLIIVATQNAQRGLSLATVLDGGTQFGGTYVQVNVANFKGQLYPILPVTSATEAAAIERMALGGNPLFKTVVTQSVAPGPVGTIFPVFTKSVVQFPDDNLADAYQNFNGVTATVFRDVLASPVIGIEGPGQVGAVVNVDPSTASTTQKSTSSAGAGLSPPWYTFRDELANTVGKTPQVAVSPLVQVGDTGSYAVAVTTANANRGVALATVLDSGQDFGNIHVTVVVASPKGHVYSPLPVVSSTQLATLERTALGGNSLFTTVVTHPIAPGLPDTVFPVFTKSVVQFFDDDTSDAYGNFNDVTADVFGDVLAGQVGGIGVDPSTATKSSTRG